MSAAMPTPDDRRNPSTIADAKAQPIPLQYLRRCHARMVGIAVLTPPYQSCEERGTHHLDHPDMQMAASLTRLTHLDSRARRIDRWNGIVGVLILPHPSPRKRPFLLMSFRQTEPREKQVGWGERSDAHHRRRTGYLGHRMRVEEAAGSVLISPPRCTKGGHRCAHPTLPGSRGSAMPVCGQSDHPFQ